VKHLTAVEPGLVAWSPGVAAGGGCRLLWHGVRGCVLCTCSPPPACPCRCIPNVLELCNGSLAGIVAVTACCGVVEPWVGLVAGALGALVFLGIDVACLRLKVRLRHSQAVACAAAAVMPAGCVADKAADPSQVHAAAERTAASSLTPRAPLVTLQIDDVVSAVPMHAGCGMLGVLLVGFFARRELVEQLYPFSGDAGV
jgi:ammonia channel protein AmtB